MEVNTEPGADEMTGANTEGTASDAVDATAAPTASETADPGTPEATDESADDALVPDAADPSEAVNGGTTAGAVESTPDGTGAAAPEPGEEVPKGVTASSELIEEIKKPISGDAPTGADITYDEDFQQLRTAIEQASLVSGSIDHEKAIGGAREKDGKGSIVSSGDVDYKSMAQLSREILRSKSKDLRLGAYLTVALFHTKKLSGLLDGLAAINALNATFWDNLHPSRPRARRSAIDLAVSRLTEPIENYKPTRTDGETIDAIVTEVNTLQSFLAEALANNVPVLSGLKEALATARRRVPKPSQKTATPAQTGPGIVRSEGAAEVPARELSKPADADRLILEASAFLRSLDNKTPLPYRLIRVARWSKFEALPPSTDGKTMIAPPGEPRRQYLAGLLDGGKFETLMQEAESSFAEPGFPVWFALQRLLAGAAAALGETFAAVHDAILFETAAFVRRLPGIVDLKFSDGTTDFADPLTREWIETSVLPVLGSSDSASNAGSGGGDVQLQEQFQDARLQLGKGDLPGALAKMSEADGVESDQKRFRIRLYQSLLCVKGGQSGIACPILESLDAEIDRRGLADWDPELALEVWVQLYRCYESIAGTTPADAVELRSKARSVYNKICEVDAASAFSFSA